MMDANKWMDGQMGRRTGDGWMGGWTGRTDSWMNGYRWVDGYMNEWIDVYIDEWVGW